MLCTAKGDVPVDLQNEMSTQIDNYLLDYKHTPEENKDEIKLDSYLTKPELLELYNQGKKYFGLVTDIKRHASAFCVAPNNVAELFGLCKTPSEDIVLNLEGKYMDELGYVKLDWLVVKVVDIIDKVYKRIGVPIPTAEELYNLVKNDDETWNIYKNGITCCVNQVEQSKTRDKVMRYKPKTVEELCAFISGIRPGFQSYYKRFENRERFEFDLKELDELLQGEYLDSSWILYQEQIMKLVIWLGFEVKESANLMKAISKKKEDKIKMISEKFHNECIKKFIENGFDKEIAEQKTESIWKVILDASSYSFNASHSYCMALDSLYIAYAKAHYPRQTYVALIKYFSECKKIDKVYKLKYEAQQYFGIEIEPHKFRQDNREGHFEGKKIYQSLSSIKECQDKYGEILYKLKDFQGNYLDLFLLMQEKGINKRVRTALIKVGYFSEFGNIGYLLFIENAYKEYSRATVSNMKKYYLEHQQYITLCWEDFISQLSNIAEKSTEKSFTFKDKLDFFKFILDNSEINDIIGLEKIYNEIYYLGMYQGNNDNLIVGRVSKFKNTGSLLLESSIDGNETWYKCTNTNVSIKEKDIIYIPSVEEKGWKRKNQDGTYTEGISRRVSNIINLTSMYK